MLVAALLLGSWASVPRAAWADGPYTVTVLAMVPTRTSRMASATTGLLAAPCARRSTRAQAACTLSSTSTAISGEKVGRTAARPHDALVRAVELNHVPAWLADVHQDPSEKAHPITLRRSGDCFLITFATISSITPFSISSSSFVTPAISLLALRTRVRSIGVSVCARRPHGGRHRRDLGPDCESR